MLRRRTKGDAPPNPSKTVAVGFAVAIIVGTVLLMLPISTQGPGGSPFRVAIFTSTSAICVTGLAVVDTATYFTTFGQTVIMLLIQAGGLGIMTGASLLFLMVSKRIGLRNRMIAQQERGSINLGDVRRVLLGVIGFSILAEIVFAIILSIRFVAEDDVGLGTAVWRGVFHAISAFNNAGFALFSDNMMGYVTDPTVSIAIAAAVIVGGIGFPVWLELRGRLRNPFRWSLHTKLTLVMTGGLLLAGWIMITATEWNNDGTLGPLSAPGKVLAGFFASVVPRTAGFNSVDYGQMHPEGILTTDMLMFAGGGSGSTAGGIKVTTLALLMLMSLAEVRGHQDVTAFGRRISATIQRQALSVAFAGINLVILGTLCLMLLSPFDFSQTLFESISAFGTVGLSTGITPKLSGAADAVLIGLMYLGRIGPLTLAIALILRSHPHRFRYPEERPLVG